MAVAVKNTPEVRSPSLLDRAPIASLIGAAYVIACLGVLGKALPYLWWEVLGFDKASMMYTVLLLMVLAAAAVGLGFVGLRVLGARAPTGTRAGVFVAVVGILIILLLTRWASVWIEYWVYMGHWFGPSGVTIGAALTAAIGLILLGVGAYYFQDRRFERYLVQLEEQGWFSATAFKPLQGIRVRRGTIFGILVIVGAGIWSLRQHGTLERGPADWEINVPFTGRAFVTDATKGDAGPMLKEQFHTDWDPVTNQLKQPIWLSRYDLRDVNDKLNQLVRIRDRGDSENEAIQPGAVVAESVFKAEVEKLKEQGVDRLPTATSLTLAGGDEVSNYVRIRDPGDSTAFAKDVIVSKKDFEAELERLRGVAKDTDQSAQTAGKKLPKALPVVLGTGTEIYTSLTLLPNVQYTVPLLLIALTMWFAWRVVNYPAFADFLIATEAELNKVSWTTRRKLIQDTIVVLLTVMLMAVFLFAMDQTWSYLLSWKQIGVIQINREQTEKKSIENRPW